MNRLVRTTLPALLMLLCAGCGTIYFDVPEGRRVKLLEQDAPASIRVEKAIWYALFGGETLSDNHTASIIEQYNLTEVRLRNEYSLLDSVINVFTSPFTFSRRRIIVYGNPATEPSP